MIALLVVLSLAVAGLAVIAFRQHRQLVAMREALADRLRFERIGRLQGVIAAANQVERTLTLQPTLSEELPAALMLASSRAQRAHAQSELRSLGVES